MGLTQLEIPNTTSRKWEGGIYGVMTEKKYIHWSEFAPPFLVGLRKIDNSHRRPAIPDPTKPYTRESIRLDKVDGGVEARGRGHVIKWDSLQNS